VDRLNVNFFAIGFLLSLSLASDCSITCAGLSFPDLLPDAPYLPGHLMPRVGGVDVRIIQSAFFHRRFGCPGDQAIVGNVTQGRREPPAADGAPASPLALTKDKTAPMPVIEGTAQATVRVLRPPKKR
jgi:hypothetical protein